MISDIDRYFDKKSFSLEIILVCDASPDDTWNRIQEAASRFPCVKGILLGKNYGQHQAILYGMYFTKGDLIVTMDDDGQHRVHSVKEMLKALNPAVDIVYGNPRRRKHDVHRYFLSLWLRLVLDRSGIMKGAYQISPLRLFRRSILPEPEKVKKFKGLVDSLILGRTSNFVSVEVDFEDRAKGESNYNFRMLTKYAFKMIFGNLEILLAYLIKLGYFGVTSCLLFGTFTFVQKLFGNISVPGYTSVIALITFATSLNLLTSGLLGKALLVLNKTLNDPDEIWTKDRTF